MAWRPLARVLAGFGVLPLLSLIAPFLLLPVLARVGGADGWAAVLLGQAAGGLGGVVAGLGWALVGPAAVARADEAGRRELFARALATRLVVLVVVAPVCALVASALSSDSHRVTAAAMSTAMAVGALSPSWYSIGASRPSAIAWYEIVPRLTATGLAAVAVLVTRELWVYPALLTVATVGGVVLYSLRVVGITAGDLRRVRVMSALWEQRAASATVTVGGSYSQTPLLVAGALAGVREVASFGSADRLYRFSLTGVQVLTNALQAWVVQGEEAPGRLLPRRMWAALALHAALGAAGLLGFALLGPWVTGVLFTAELAASAAVSACFGVAFLGISLNSALGRLVLVPQGRTRQVLTSTTVGAVVGLGAMAGLGSAYGVLGVAAGFALSELAVTGYQAVVVARGPRGRSQP